MFDKLRARITKYVAQQQLRLLSSLYVQPFNFFSSQSRVRAETALSLSACYCAIDRISSDLAVLPLDVYKRRKNAGTGYRGADLAYDHYLMPLLHESPDEIRTAFNHRKLTVAHILGYGNGYHERVTTNGGKVTGLFPLHPNRVEPKVISGKHVYSVDNDQQLLPPEKIIHMYGLSYDGMSGISPVRAASTAFAVGMSADAHTLGFFNNNAQPNGMIKFPGKYSPEFEKQFRDTWNEGHQGVERSGKVGLLFGGAEWQGTSMSPLDSQLVEQRRYSVSDIARIYHVPLNLLMEWTNAHYASAEESTIDYVVSCLAMWCACIEQAYTWRLLTRQERDQGYFIEFALMRLLRGNTEVRAKYYQSGIQNGWLTPNDCRVQENLPPMPGGDVLLIQKNMVPLHMLESTAMANVGSAPTTGGGALDQGAPVKDPNAFDDIDSPTGAISQPNMNSRMRDLMPGVRTSTNGIGVHNAL